MSIEIKVPQAGESITEGVLGRWLVADGAMATKGAPVFELETDKTNTEVPAPESGVLKHLVKEGEVVLVGATVGSIDAAGVATAAPASVEAKPAASPATAKAAAFATPPARAAVVATAPPPVAPPPAAKHSANGKPAFATPLAKRIMAEHGLDSGAITPSGHHGRIVRADVLHHIEMLSKSGPAVARHTPVMSGGRATRRVPLGIVRKTFMQRLLRGKQTAAMLTTFNEIDMSAVIALRARYGESFQKRHGAPLSDMAFFVRASVDALRLVTRANAMIEGDEIVSFDFCDIGFAIDTAHGSVIPVLRNAQDLSLPAIARNIAETTTRAKEGKLGLAEISGGTFTILNDGVHGALISTPMLNTPQTAVLGLHKVMDRPVADERRAVVARPMMHVALSYDHRMLDGKDAVEFLIRIKECVEAPERLLLEV